jgi:hypothetical protein
LDLQPLTPNPLVALGSYATVGTCEIAKEPYVVASIHPLARPAIPEEVEGLDPDVVRRSDVTVPWVNDVAFHHLRQVVNGRRFLVGADLNTSRLFADGGPAFFRRAAEAGWVDVVSEFHGDQVPTFLTSRSHLHQLDYLFCDQATAAALHRVEIVTSVTDRLGDKTSDHAIVKATFEVDGDE